MYDQFLHMIESMEYILGCSSVFDMLFLLVVLVPILVFPLSRYCGKSTTMYWGCVPSSRFSFSLKTVSITLPTAPLYNPQSGSKFLPLICTLAPLQTFNDEFMCVFFFHAFCNSFICYSP